MQSSQRISMVVATALLGLGGLTVSGAALSADNTMSGSQSTSQSSGMSEGQGMSHDNGMSGSQKMSHNSGMSNDQGMSHSMSKSRIKSLQQALNQHGADIATDGKMGPKTKQALRNYQQRSNLQVTGRPDSKTLSSLGMSASGMQQNGDTMSGGSSMQSDQRMSEDKKNRMSANSGKNENEAQ